MRRRWIGRLLLALASLLLWLGIAELWLRRSVGACGLTPFRNATIAGIPHELVPGRVTTYRGVEVRINRLGFRGGELGPRPEGAQRIALVGDSFTFGNGCREEETLAASLERELARRGRPAQVLNCGVPAFNADDVLALTVGRVLALAPDRVVYVMVANDVDVSQQPGDIPADATIDSFAEFPLHSAALQWLGIKGAALLRATGLRGGGYVDSILGRWKAEGGGRIEKAFEGLAAACKERGAALTVAIYPFMVRRDRNPFAPIEEDAARRCARLGIPCVPLVDAFGRDEELARYWIGPLDTHPDGRANAKAAAYLAEQLAK
jgi:hypothetical protein